MNIAFINSEYPPENGLGHGGIATYTYIIANALSEIGHKVHVLARNGTIPDNLSKSVEFHSFNFFPPSSRVWSFISRKFDKDIFWENGYSKGAFSLIQKLHAKIPFDIVEIPEYNGLASQFKNPLPFALVINFHTPTPLIDELNRTAKSKSQKRKYSLEKKGVQNAIAYRCPSRSLAKRLPSFFPISFEEITLIRNPIPCTVLSPKMTNNRNSKDQFKILFSGRLERRKGVDIILSTLKNILNIDTKISITFAGETKINESINYQSTIKTILNEKELERVIFLGPVNGKTLMHYYSESDVLLMPSLFENAPYSILEAMRLKLPVIGADTDGINEIIQHEETGLLFSLNKRDELCACIKTLVRKPEYGNYLADNAYTYIDRIHNSLIIAKQTISFYKKLIKSKCVFEK